MTRNLIAILARYHAGRGRSGRRYPDRGRRHNNLTSEQNDSVACTLDPRPSGGDLPWHFRYDFTEHPGVCSVESGSQPKGLIL